MTSRHITIAADRFPQADDPGTWCTDPGTSCTNVRNQNNFNENTILPSAELEPSNKPEPSGPPTYGSVIAPVSHAQPKRAAFGTALVPAARCIASGFGSGYAPRAPGTVGSIAALAPALLLAQAHLLLPFTALLGVLGYASVSLILRTGISSDGSPGHREPAAPTAPAQSEKHEIDPQWIVVDEWIGTWIAVLSCQGNFFHSLVALLFFRIFDICKPGPVRWAEQLPGAWGIIADDFLAGCLALLVYELLMKVAL